LGGSIRMICLPRQRRRVEQLIDEPGVRGFRLQPEDQWRVASGFSRKINAGGSLPPKGGSHVANNPTMVIDLRR
jgi:hypothetical protein